MKKSWQARVVTFGFVLTSLVAWAEAPEGLDGHWVSTADKQTPQLSLHVNAQKNSLEVTLPPKTPLTEPTIGVTFFRGDGTQTTLELAAVQQAKAGGKKPAVFQGSVNPWDSSYIGFEIRLPLKSGKRVVPSKEFKRLSP